MSEGACLGGEVRLDAGFQKEQRENGAKSEETVPGRFTCGIPDFLCTETCEPYSRELRQTIHRRLNM